MPVDTGRREYIFPIMVVYISSVMELLSVIQLPFRRLRVCANEGDTSIRRRRALKRVDRELDKGNYTAAMSLVKQLKAHPAGLLPGFGAASPNVPRSVSSLQELKLMGETEMSSLQLVVDAILCSMKRSLEFQLQEEESKVSIEDFEPAMDVDSIHEDHLMCMHHEAGHFLLGYMLGVLPRSYKVPSMEDLLQDRFVRGKVEFVGFEFLKDVGALPISNRNFSKGKPNKENLKKFSCVIIGGMTAEHLMFGYSELLHSDVKKLVTVLEWIGFTEKEVDYTSRRAAEAAVLILCGQRDALCRLAEAMALGKSVGSCFETIERALNLHRNLSRFENS